MGKQNVVNLVESLVNDVIRDSELELVDVEYAKDGKDWVLRVFIDKPDGVDIEDCRSVSLSLSNKLDEADPIPNAYTLEVSSPGLERPLKREQDFHNFMGNLVNIRTYQAIDGIKEFEGNLIGFENGIVKLQVNGEDREIPYDQIAKARLAVEF